MYFFDLVVQNQSQEGSIIPLSAGFGGMVLILVIIIFVLSVILIKSRKSVLSQKIDTRHYTKPPAGDHNVILNFITYFCIAFLNIL